MKNSLEEEKQKELRKTQEAQQAVGHIATANDVKDLDLTKHLALITNWWQLRTVVLALCNSAKTTVLELTSENQKQWESNRELFEQLIYQLKIMECAKDGVHVSKETFALQNYLRDFDIQGPEYHNGKSIDPSLHFPKQDRHFKQQEKYKSLRAQLQSISDELGEKNTHTDAQLKGRKQLAEMTRVDFDREFVLLFIKQASADVAAHKQESQNSLVLAYQIWGPTKYKSLMQEPDPQKRAEAIAEFCTWLLTVDSNRPSTIPNSWTDEEKDSFVLLKKHYAKMCEQYAAFKAKWQTEESRRYLLFTGKEIREKLETLRTVMPFLDKAKASISKETKKKSDNVFLTETCKIFENFVDKAQKQLEQDSVDLYIALLTRFKTWPLTDKVMECATDVMGQFEEKQVCHNNAVLTLAYGLFTRDVGDLNQQDLPSLMIVICEDYATLGTSEQLKIKQLCQQMPGWPKNKQGHPILTLQEKDIQLCQLYLVNQKLDFTDLEESNGETTNHYFDEQVKNRRVLLSNVLAQAKEALGIIKLQQAEKAQEDVERLKPSSSSRLSSFLGFLPKKVEYIIGIENIDISEWEKKIQDLEEKLKPSPHAKTIVIPSPNIIPVTPVKPSGTTEPPKQAFVSMTNSEEYVKFLVSHSENKVPESGNSLFLSLLLGAFSTLYLSQDTKKFKTLYKKIFGAEADSKQFQILLDQYFDILDEKQQKVFLQGEALQQYAQIFRLGIVRFMKANAERFDKHVSQISFGEYCKKMQQPDTMGEQLEIISASLWLDLDIQVWQDGQRVQTDLEALLHEQAQVVYLSSNKNGIYSYFIDESLLERVSEETRQDLKEIDSSSEDLSSRSSESKDDDGIYKFDLTNRLSHATQEKKSDVCKGFLRQFDIDDKKIVLTEEISLTKGMTHIRATIVGENNRKVVVNFHFSQTSQLSEKAACTFAIKEALFVDTCRSLLIEMAINNKKLLADLARMDRRFIIDLLEKYPGSILDLPTDLQDDEIFQLVALNGKGSLLKSLNCKQNADLVFVAATQDPTALQYALVELNVLQYLSILYKDGMAVQFIDDSKILETKELIFQAVTQTPKCLGIKQLQQYQKDIDVILAACETDSSVALQHVYWDVFKQNILDRLTGIEGDVFIKEASQKAEKKEQEEKIKRLFNFIVLNINDENITFPQWLKDHNSFKSLQTEQRERKSLVYLDTIYVQIKNAQTTPVNLAILVPIIQQVKQDYSAQATFGDDSGQKDGIFFSKDPQSKLLVILESLPSAQIESSLEKKNIAFLLDQKKRADTAVTMKKESSMTLDNIRIVVQGLVEKNNYALLEWSKRIDGMSPDALEEILSQYSSFLKDNHEIMRYAIAKNSACIKHIDKNSILWKSEEFYRDILKENYSLFYDILKQREFIFDRTVETILIHLKQYNDHVKYREILINLLKKNPDRVEELLPYMTHQDMYMVFLALSQGKTLAVLKHGISCALPPFLEKFVVSIDPSAIKYCPFLRKDKVFIEEQVRKGNWGVYEHADPSVKKDLDFVARMIYIEPQIENFVPKMLFEIVDPIKDHESLDDYRKRVSVSDEYFRVLYARFEKLKTRSENKKREDSDIFREAWGKINERNISFMRALCAFGVTKYLPKFIKQVTYTEKQLSKGWFGSSSKTVSRQEKTEAFIRANKKPIEKVSVLLRNSPQKIGQDPRVCIRAISESDFDIIPSLGNDFQLDQENLLSICTNNIGMLQFVKPKITQDTIDTDRVDVSFSNTNQTPIVMTFSELKTFYAAVLKRNLLSKTSPKSEVIDHIHVELLKDKDIAKLLVQINGEFLEKLPVWKNDNEIVALSVKQTGTAIRHASVFLKNTYEFALRAIQDKKSITVIFQHYQTSNANILFDVTFAKAAKKILSEAEYKKYFSAETQQKLSLEEHKEKIYKNHLEKRVTVYMLLQPLLLATKVLKSSEDISHTDKSPYLNGIIEEIVNEEVEEKINDENISVQEWHRAINTLLDEKSRSTDTNAQTDIAALRALAESLEIEKTVDTLNSELVMAKNSEDKKYRVLRECYETIRQQIHAGIVSQEMFLTNYKEEITDRIKKKHEKIEAYQSTACHEHMESLIFTDVETLTNALQLITQETQTRCKQLLGEIDSLSVGKIIMQEIELFQLLKERLKEEVKAIGEDDKKLVAMEETIRWFKNHAAKFLQILNNDLTLLPDERNSLKKDFFGCKKITEFMWVKYFYTLKKDVYATIGFTDELCVLLSDSKQDVRDAARSRVFTKFTGFDEKTDLKTHPIFSVTADEIIQIEQMLIEYKKKKQNDTILSKFIQRLEIALAARKVKDSYIKYIQETLSLLQSQDSKLDSVKNNLLLLCGMLWHPSSEKNIQNWFIWFSEHVEKNPTVEIDVLCNEFFCKPYGAMYQKIIVPQDGETQEQRITRVHGEYCADIELFNFKNTIEKKLLELKGKLKITDGINIISENEKTLQLIRTEISSFKNSTKVKNILFDSAVVLQALSTQAQNIEDVLTVQKNLIKFSKKMTDDSVFMDTEQQEITDIKNQLDKSEHIFKEDKNLSRILRELKVTYTSVNEKFTILTSYQKKMGADLLEAQKSWDRIDEILKTANADRSMTDLSALQGELKDKIKFIKSFFASIQSTSKFIAKCKGANETLKKIETDFSQRVKEIDCVVNMQSNEEKIIKKFDDIFIAIDEGITQFETDHMAKWEITQLKIAIKTAKTIFLYAHEKDTTHKEQYLATLPLIKEGMFSVALVDINSPNPETQAKQLEHRKSMAVSSPQTIKKNVQLPFKDVNLKKVRSQILDVNTRKENSLHFANYDTIEKVASAVIDALVKDLGDPINQIQEKYFLPTVKANSSSGKMIADFVNHAVAGVKHMASDVGAINSDEHPYNKLLKTTVMKTVEQKRSSTEAVIPTEKIEQQDVKIVPKNFILVDSDFFYVEVLLVLKELQLSEKLLSEWDKKIPEESQDFYADVFIFLVNMDKEPNAKNNQQSLLKIQALRTKADILSKNPMLRKRNSPPKNAKESIPVVLGMFKPPQQLPEPTALQKIQNMLDLEYDTPKALLNDIVGMLKKVSLDQVVFKNFQKQLESNEKVKMMKSDMLHHYLQQVLTNFNSEGWKTADQELLGALQKLVAKCERMLEPPKKTVVKTG